MHNLTNTLKTHQAQLHSILPNEFNGARAIYLDLTENNQELKQIDISDQIAFAEYIKQQEQKHNAKLSIGRYAEDRTIYKTHTLFKAARSIHLGIDLSLKAGTEIHCPLDATLHSFKDNNTKGDYGATIILQHKLDGIVFYSLYGHLATASLKNIAVGQSIKAGENFASIGNQLENGGWNPHLHLQIIKDINGYFGDYPGVCSKKQADNYLSNCPDPSDLVLTTLNLVLL